MQSDSMTQTMGNSTAVQENLSIETDVLTDAERTITVLIEIRERRMEQDLRWNRQDHDQSYWLAVLMHEMGEYASVIALMRQDAEVDRQGRDLTERLRRKLIDIAATAAAAAESYDREYEEYGGHIQMCRAEA